MTSRRLLSVVAGISLVYDLATGLVLFVATDRMASWFGVAVPHPIIFVKLNALFLMAVGVGYYKPLVDPAAHRAYLWIFGPWLKGAGAITFVVDHYMNGSPDSFLLFAASDGLLAALTLVALVMDRAASAHVADRAASAHVADRSASAAGAQAAPASARTGNTAESPRR